MPTRSMLICKLIIENIHGNALCCRISLKVRMVTAALVMIAMFVLTVALVKINTDACKYIYPSDTLNWVN